MQREKLSALMDGEALDSEVVSILSKDSAMQKHWENYHLIRDTLRGDVTEVLHMDIASRVARVLEKEPVHFNPGAVPESQPQPEAWQKATFWQKLRPWGSQITQVGVAACVSLAVLIGVQQYNSHNSVDIGYQSDTPVFNTLPIMGSASPVSLGVPSGDDMFGNDQRIQVQERNKRINIMLQQYELDRRVHFEQNDGQGIPPQAAISVPGTQSLGTQQQ
ncbi:Anti-sigma-E factor RseA [Photorhabdus australis subsp. thailandensis]|uniref:Anti-sigma-E factor RseA n=1 Tax=Photorhabdus australis subsp. thailandensis TaxID=2805096 RepID=A0A1C0U195_9GAMM|nr:anti-sigma-E factor RseA [Photorhabdus australis]OCQ51707.1 Anti-sigma-E factor RseA [Photorhabdus australis subsp. thailandensis]